MKQLLLAILLWMPLAGMAQENTSIAKDTTLFVNGRKLVIKEQNNKIKVKLYEQSSSGDTIKNDQVFEGIYLNGQSTEQRLSFSIPFTKKKSYEGRNFSPHYAGFYMGYTGFGSADKEVDLVGSKSWEIGLSLIDLGWTLNPSKTLGVVTGLGWGYKSFRLQNPYIFQETAGNTIVTTQKEGDPYYEGRLRYNYFSIPLLLEWQYNTHRSGRPFISVGAEAEIRYRIQSKAKSDGHKHTIGKDMNVLPVGVNLMVQAGISKMSVYARYSLTNLFKSGKGPEMHPLSLGVALCW